MEILKGASTSILAAAGYVRIQTMARKHHIPLDVEFDEHDSPETQYVVVMDGYLPIATCRMYPLDAGSVMLSRIVVLPEYRHQGIGSLVVKEAEGWAREQGFKTAVLESRDNKIPFYESLGYIADYGRIKNGETFTCCRMEKALEFDCLHMDKPELA